MVLPDVKSWELPPDNTSLGAFSLKYPLSAGWKSLGIGAIIAIFTAIILLPIIFLWGYRYRIARAGARGDDSAPEFDNFGNVIWNGVVLVGAFLPYVLVAGLLTVVVAALGSAISETAATVMLIFWIIAVNYVGIAIHPTFVATGSIKQTYAGGLFIKVAATREYLIGVLVGFVLRLLVGIAMFVLLIVSIITLIGPFIVFALWYAYDEYIPGAVWGYVAHSLAERDVLPAVTAETQLDY